MTPSDVAKLLTTASGFDNRIVDEGNARAWYMALHEWDYRLCEQALVAHFTEPETRHRYLTVGLLLDRLERDARVRGIDIETDVRAAKARGLIATDWPAKQALPPTVASRLASAREYDRQEAERYEPTPDGSWAIGDGVGRRVDD